MCVINTSYNGCHSRVSLLTNYKTCWIANRQDEHSTEERISICSNKENCHIITSLNFHKYDFTQCLPSNTKALCIPQLWCNPQYLRNRNTISISNFVCVSVNNGFHYERKNTTMTNLQTKYRTLLWIQKLLLQTQSHPTHQFKGRIWWYVTV